MAQVACEHGRTPPPLFDDLVLLDSGLDSLGIAVLIARLEYRLAINPFSTSEDIQLPVTIVDFIKAYENSEGSGSVFAKTRVRSGEMPGASSLKFYRPIRGGRSLCAAMRPKLEKKGR
jgi:hypothetical protein